MAGKSKRVIVRMVSSADTGHFYTTTINPRNRQGSGKFKKKMFDPVIRKHVEYVEKKIK